MARAASYGAWRAAPRGHVPDFADIRAADARTLAHEFLRQAPDGGWLSTGQTTDLLGCYGILLAGGEDTSATVAARAGGTEVIVAVAADHTFGSLVSLGSCGADPRPAELVAGHTARLTPLTDIDADQLIRGVAPGRTYLRDLLLRVSQLADDLPEVTRLDLSPAIAGPDGTIIMAARIKMAPYEPHDPFLRKLRALGLRGHRATAAGIAEAAYAVRRRAAVRTFGSPFGSPATEREREFVR